MVKKDITNLLSLGLRKTFQKIEIDADRLQEIRLRSEKPIILKYDNKEYFINNRGEMIRSCEGGICTSQSEIKETLEYIGNYSLYAYEDEIGQGFLTVSGGHRVGVAGKVMVEPGRRKSMKYISSINIRLAHEIKGCADKVIPFLFNKEGEFLHTLIISPPLGGKTTLLRDIVRQVSDGKNGLKGLNIGLVDERSEIAACHLGVPQNDVGIRTDVLDCCPKAEGMEMLLRSMAPQVMAADEIGLEKDAEVLRHVFGCGCKILATVHGQNINELKKRQFFKSFFEDKLFERYVVINKGIYIYDEQERRINA